jgi:hypothetical protein
MKKLHGPARLAALGKQDANLTARLLNRLGQSLDAFHGLALSAFPIANFPTKIPLQPPKNTRPQSGLVSILRRSLVFLLGGLERQALLLVEPAA